MEEEKPMNPKDENPTPARSGQGLEAERPSRKVYRSPSLVVYGDIFEITQGTQPVEAVQDGAETTYTAA